MDLNQTVRDVLAGTPVLDIHTHLFPRSFNHLALGGIDDLLTYHYLEAELFRSSHVVPAHYWMLSKSERADLVWQTLFVENNPISEAARGVIAVLHALGLDTAPVTLATLREFFESQHPGEHLTRVFDLAGVSAVVMTNDPLDPAEAAIWERGFESDPRFHPALRLDRVLAQTGEAGNPASVRQFLEDWCLKMKPVYMGVSLPDTFEFPGEDARSGLIRDAVLPTCREFKLPLALMIGVRREVNPALALAGDAAGRADLRAVENLCRDFPDNRFLVTVLSRENQHELCIYARKFANLMPFGCWWFLNNPSMVDEITRERLEMLGASFIPQHSDARVLEQIIYKWRNTRRTLADVLADRYRLLAEDGRMVTREQIQRDVTRMFQGNFAAWSSLASPALTGGA